MNDKVKEDLSGKVRCAIKNCQKLLEPDEVVKIGDLVLCKSCAVYYVKTQMPFFG
ncbi:MAG: hypothetical protein ACTSVI_06440 [Promethearchaeota archaeon]